MPLVAHVHVMLLVLLPVLLLSLLMLLLLLLFVLSHVGSWLFSCFFFGGGYLVAKLMDPDSERILRWASTHGGRHQRAEAQRAMANLENASLNLSPTAPTPYGGSHEYELLLQLWSLGAIPTYWLQEIGAAATRDGNTNPAMQSLAQLGSNGAWPANCRRDLERLLSFDQMDLPTASSIKIPMKTPGTNNVSWDTCPILYPHELVHAIYTHYYAEFELRFLGGSVTNLPYYWEGVLDDDPRWARHPLREEDDFQHKAIPARVHGDAVPCLGMFVKL